MDAVAHSPVHHRDSADTTPRTRPARRVIEPNFFFAVAGRLAASRFSSGQRTS
jgi:hypothetical protein